MLADAYVGNLMKQTVLLDGAEEVCRALYGKYKMYIITNGIEAVQNARFGGCAIKEYFEKCYISDAIGVAKPKKGFFDAVAADIEGFDKSKALVIGDSLTSDIKGGVEYGIDTCWLNPKGKEAPEGMNITYVIKDIRDILEILE
jgi:2-haloacid dehalogenase